MRISIININLMPADAVGHCIDAQVTFFQKRGDQVRVYVSTPPEYISQSLKQVTSTENPSGLTVRDIHFGSSDLYIYHYPVYYPLLESMGSLRRGAVLFYYHNVTPVEYARDEDTRRFLLNSKDKVSYFANLSDLVVTPSPYNRDTLIRDHGFPAEKIRVLPNFVSLRDFYSGPKPIELLKKHDIWERDILLFTGRFAANKELPQLVRALAIIKKSIDAVVLILVGDDNSNIDLLANRETVEDLVNDSGLQNNIIFAGVVEEIEDYFRLADIYVTASNHEGFGVPLIEAMATGTPVVASNIPAHTWVLNGCGMLFDNDKPEQAAESVLTLLRDKMAYGKLAQSGCERARRFSLDVYYSQLHSLVSEVTKTVPVRTSLENGDEAESKPTTQGQARPASDADISDAIDVLRPMASLVDPNYTMTSNIPIFGRLISGFRWLVSKQLKIGYVDHTLRRQENFNNRLIDLLEQSLLKKDE